MTPGKTIVVTRQTLVSKVMSLLLNMLSKKWQEYTEELYKKDLHDSDNHDGVITFLPRSKRLLISWLQSPSAVILDPKKNKV